LPNGGISNTDAYISSYNYFDITASMNLTDKITFRLGVNNILDKDPPIIGTTNLPGTSGNGNTFPQTYDALGRFVFAPVEREVLTGLHLENPRRATGPPFFLCARRAHSLGWALARSRADAERRGPAHAVRRATRARPFRA